MAETPPGGTKEKEDVNASALAAEVSDIGHTSVQMAEIIDLSEFNQESVAQVLPLIAEEATTHVLVKAKKTRRPRKNKKKNDSNTTGQPSQMQPHYINQPSSSASEKIEVHSIQEPSTSKMNPPDNIKLLAAEQGVTEAAYHEDPVTQVLPVIAEEVLTNILGNPKKAKKLRQKEKKNKSNATTQALQMQPANMNQASSSAGEKIEGHSIPEPFTSEITILTNPDNRKPLSAEQNGSIKEADKATLKFVDSSEFYQESVAQVQPVIAKEMITNMLEKPIKTRKSERTEQALQIQPDNITKAKNRKTLGRLVEQDVPDAISDQDHITQVLPVIAEEDVSTNILGKPENPQHNKNISNTTEQAIQMQPAHIDKASSSVTENTQVNFTENTSKSMIYITKLVKKSSRLARRGIPSDQYSIAQALPVIVEETPEEILKNEEPKKQGKPRQKKKKNKSSKVEQALQMLPADTDRASSASNVEKKNLVETQDARAVDFGKNEMNQKSETGHQKKTVLVAVESKHHVQTKSMVNNNTTETKTTKKNLTVVIVPEENSKLQTSKDAMQQTDEKAEGSGQTPAQINYFPSKAVGKDEEPHSSKDFLKRSDQTTEGNAEPQVQRHLLFFRENYDHNGFITSHDFDEGRLNLDGLYSQVKLGCMNLCIKEKIQKVIHILMNEITINFKDLSVPVEELEILFNRMHNIIFMRLYRVGITELDSIETCDILAIYRSYYKEADDLQFLFSLMSSEHRKYFSQ